MTPRTVFVGTCDPSGQLRGRSVPYSQHDAVLARGTGWVPANLALTCFGPIAEPNAFGSTGDLRLLPDPETAVDLPDVRVYLAGQSNLDGTAWASCPRAMLVRALERLRRETGLTVLASFEHEFTLTGLASGTAMSFARARAAEPFGGDLVELLERAGLEPENWLPEYGDGQYEITTRPAGGVRAADRAILLREMVRDLARQRGLRATFAPIIDPEPALLASRPTNTVVGNGVHIHLSLRDDHGRPALYDPAKKGNLSEVGARFCAGIVAHASAITAVTAGSPVSFLRLRPHMWSAGGAFVGERDREALIRICPTVSFDGADPAEQFNVEYRAADATANPWLVLGTLVSAGLQGILGDYSVTDAGPLPASLPEALAALESDEVASGWFDPTLLSTYLRVKRAELAAVDGLKDAEACQRVADVF